MNNLWLSACRASAISSAQSSWELDEQVSPPERSFYPCAQTQSTQNSRCHRVCMYVRANSPSSLHSITRNTWKSRWTVPLTDRGWARLVLDYSSRRVLLTTHSTHCDKAQSRPTGHLEIDTHRYGWMRGPYGELTKKAQKLRRVFSLSFYLRSMEIYLGKATVSRPVQ